MNELDTNGTIVKSNGANGALPVTSNGESYVNGATPLTNGNVAEYSEAHENANFDNSKLEIQLETKADTTKQVKDKEPESMFVTHNTLNNTSNATLLYLSISHF